MNEENIGSERTKGLGKAHRFQRLSSLVGRYVDVKKSANDKREQWIAYVNEYQRKARKLRNGKIDPNHGKFRMEIDERIDAYVDIISERDRWANIVSYYGDSEEESAFYSKEITRAFHDFCIARWTDRHENTALDIFDMVMFAKGHEWYPTKLGCWPKHLAAERVFPNETAGLHSDKWDIVFIVDKLTAMELWERANNEARVSVEGWNKEKVDMFLQCAIPQGATDDTVDIESFRNGSADADDEDQTYSIVYAYVKEYSKNKNRITRYVFPDPQHIVEDDASKTDEQQLRDQIDEFGFLAVKPSYEKDFNLIINVRTDQITDSYYQCPSWASMIYFNGVFYNTSMNKVIRSVIRNIHLFLKSSSPDEQQKLANLDADREVTVLDPDTDVVQQAVNVNWSGLMEVIRQVDFDTRRGLRESLPTGSQNVKGRAITAKEAEINLQQSNQAQTASHKIFNISDQRVVRSIYRRFIDSNRMTGSENEMGYKLFVRRMERLGIPKDAWKEENVIVNSVLNYGSTSAGGKLQSAQALLSAIRQYLAAKSEGEKKAATDMISAIVGRENAKYYVPDTQIDKFQLTELFRIGSENSDLDDPHLNPMNVQVNPDRDDHPLHISGHTADIDYRLKIAEALFQSYQEAFPNEKPIILKEIGDILKSLDNKGAHVEAHIAVLMPATGDPTIEQMVKAARMQLNSLRQREQQLEQLYAKEYQQSQEDFAEDQFLTRKEQHELRMSQIRLEEAEAMKNLRLMQQVEKGDLNRMGAEANTIQKLRHKEEEHIAEMTNEQKTESGTESSNSKNGG